MSWVMVSPELVVAAAADLAGIGSAISSANAAAAVNTTGLLTAGADEGVDSDCGVVRCPRPGLPGGERTGGGVYAQFVQALSAGGGAYAAAEAAAVSPLLAPINAQFVAATGPADRQRRQRRPRDRSQRRARRVVDRQRRRAGVWRPRRWGRR